MFNNFLSFVDLVWPMVIVWISIVIVAVYIEANTFELLSIWFAVGALPSVFMAIFKVPLQWQILSFAIVSILFIIVSRPFVSKFQKSKTLKTNVDELIGETVVVTEEIPVDGKGEIKSKYDYFGAICKNLNEPIKVGTKVVIKEISGNKVIVDLI